jgi:hypothetical protein
MPSARMEEKQANFMNNMVTNSDDINSSEKYT